MFLKEFYSGDSSCICISAEQASLFAKEIARDFNPLHDIDAKKFCVPGDLLFSIVLEKYGLSRQMNFTFSGMLGRDVSLNFPQTNAAEFDIVSSHHKTILSVSRSGELSQDKAMIEALIRDYVAFSGYSFPYVLVPLMSQQNVMINLNRPLLIYDSMSLEFKHFNFTQPKVEVLDSKLSVNGKRGEAHLYFQVKSDTEIVGEGFKRIVISGMRRYEEKPMQAFIDNYQTSKEVYLQAVEAKKSRA